jgi:hypothetical protein
MKTDTTADIIHADILLVRREALIFSHQQELTNLRSEAQAKSAQHREEKERWYVERATFESALENLEQAMAQQARGMAAIEEEVLRYQADRDGYEQQRVSREEEVQAERNHLIERIRTQVSLRTPSPPPPSLSLRFHSLSLALPFHPSFPAIPPTLPVIPQTSLSAIPFHPRLERHRRYPSLQRRRRTQSSH